MNGLPLRDHCDLKRWYIGAGGRLLWVTVSFLNGDIFPPRDQFVKKPRVFTVIVIHMIFILFYCACVSQRGRDTVVAV